jgi:hypothetical protein
MNRAAVRGWALLAVWLCALAGCGKSEPRGGSKPPEDKGQTPAPAQLGKSPTQPGGASSSPTGPGPIGPTDPRQVAAEGFIRDLRAAANPGPVPPPVVERLSLAFLKVIGKPTLTAAAKTAGYSTDAASDWLGKAGRGLASVGIPMGHGANNVAVFIGSFNSDSIPDGRILLRLVQEDGSWKVDWFQPGSVRETSPLKPANADEAFQGFAAQAFLDAITGETALPLNDRVPLVAALLSPSLRQSIAEPFGQDRERGYDYNPARIAQRADEWGHGATAYSRTRTGPGQYRVEITKAGKPRAYSLKLVKGQGPGEWLVDEFAAQ